MILTFLYQPSIGETMTYVGGSDTALIHGDDTSVLTVGQSYVIEDVFPFNFHTKVSLKDLSGKFNSICFKPLEKPN